jgi:hypothetical protein
MIGDICHLFLRNLACFADMLLSFFGCQVLEVRAQDFAQIGRLLDQTADFYDSKSWSFWLILRIGF